MAKVKEELKAIPGFSQGVRDNAALRMVKLARPICPMSKIEMERDAQGVPRPKNRGPNTENCQMAGGEWWKSCAEKGHDPFFTSHTWYVPEDVIVPVLDTEGNPIPDKFQKTGETLVAHSEKRPNVAAIAIATRINQGKGATKAIEVHGFKRLTDIGYFEVCQFRACQRPVARKARSKKYGDFCSRDHLSLCAADAEGIALTYVHADFNKEHLPREQRRRDKELNEVLLGAGLSD